METKETRYAPLFLSVRAFSTTKNFLNKRNPFQLVERSPPLEIARVEDAPGDHANSMKESPVPFPTFRLFALVSFFFPPPFVLPLSLSSFFFSLFFHCSFLFFAICEMNRRIFAYISRSGLFIVYKRWQDCSSVVRFERVEGD